ncbi:hypothetical protein AA101099_2790 [Neoasaia chiangmaiensis NBRC 101099]|nr:hypothetical protein AA101099_2790 [Neoasaia chiangmaiensis NBRC 101099]GEN14132.1 double-region [Neoasaia chiangmaiensis]
MIGLLALPLIWWLIKATPPLPRTQVFPSLMVLRRLHPRREDTVRAPLWLLILRVTAAALLIVGLAQPVHRPQEIAAAGHSGRLILILDDGWSAAPHWSERLRAARALGDRALQQGREVVLLRAARGDDGALPEPLVTRDAARFDDTVQRLRPAPWPVDRHALVAALAQFKASGDSVTILADGVATSDDTALRQALDGIGPVSDMRWPACDIATLGATSGDDLHVRVSALPCGTRHFQVRARNAEGGTLGVYPLDLPGGAAQAEATLPLPPALRNQTARLTLSNDENAGNGTVGPATIRLLDEGDRRRPVGLLSMQGDDTPLVGAGFYLNHALGPLAELHQGTAQQLLTGALSVLIAPDGTLSQDNTRKRVADWVRKGGELIRFAGPALAADSDTPNVAEPLLPVALMSGVRQLGGPMSWGTPQKLAAFPDDSPFAGLNAPPEVTISRQVLARPAADLNDHVWARLTDGTPLVTATSYGHGEIVLFHVTAGADWSSLPLSGLFPDMLQRLIQRSAGLRGGAPVATLAPAATLDADGLLGAPPSGARPLAAADFSKTVPSAEHPPGLYGPRAQRRALNLGDNMPNLMPEPRLGTPILPVGAQADQPIGPILLAIGLVLLLLDLLLSLRRRGLLGRLAVLAALLPLAGHAETQTPPDVPPAALQTRLAYVVTGHDDVDEASREGLAGLSTYASDRSSAQLGPPDAIHPGQDDLAFYPLIYWPVTPDTQADAKRTAALNSFMAHGGIILIDTQGAGSDLDPDGAHEATAALKRATDGLAVPPLMKLDDHHVLGHTFYLLHDFPGRVAGQPVWVARGGDESLDDVSPVIIGAGDWAHAWAVGADGNHPYAVIPGGDEQRVQAYRFGVNIVLYALTGNYKADQMKVPALLERMGQ